MLRKSVLLLSMMFFVLEVCADKYEIEIEEERHPWRDSSKYSIDIRKKSNFGNLFESKERRVLRSAIKGLNNYLEARAYSRQHRFNRTLAYARALSDARARLQEAELLRTQTELVRYRLEQEKATARRKAAPRQKVIKRKRNQPVYNNFSADLYYRKPEKLKQRIIEVLGYSPGMAQAIVDYSLKVSRKYRMGMTPAVFMCFTHEFKRSKDQASDLVSRLGLE